jgi:hypothetical protein
MSDGISAISFDPAATDPSRAAGTLPAAAQAGGTQAAQAQGTTAAKSQGQAGTGKTQTGQGDTLHLSEEAKAEVAKLQSRDSDVRAHEQAHMAAGGGLVTSGASYTYEKGPDGRMYAVGGEVGIDTSPVKGDPQATIAKAMHIEVAALAPADPSGQDRSVAAAAAAMASQAAGEAAKQVASGPKDTGQTGSTSAKETPQTGAPSGKAGAASGKDTATKAVGSLVDVQA